jgi:hypothetical protein
MTLLFILLGKWAIIEPGITVQFFLFWAWLVSAFVFVLGLPGRIAVARTNPDAEAINIMGWGG